MQVKYMEMHVGNATLLSTQKSEMGGESVWCVGKVGGLYNCDVAYIYSGCLGHI